MASSWKDSEGQPSVDSSSIGHQYAWVAYVRSKHRSEKPECGGSTPSPGTKGIRKVDDLFAVTWLNKDTRETVYNVIRSINYELRNFST